MAERALSWRSRDQSQPHCPTLCSPYMWGKIAGSSCTVGKNYPLWWANYNNVSCRAAAGMSRGRVLWLPVPKAPTAVNTTAELLLARVVPTTALFLQVPGWPPYNSFGGWSKPAIHQFSDAGNACGVRYDKNYY